MRFRIQIADTPELGDALFQARHRCFMQQHGFLQERPDGRYVDRYDTLPGTWVANFVLLVDGEVQGGIRLTRRVDGEATAADDNFDFSPWLEGRVAAAVTMLFVDRNYRNDRCARSLVDMMYDRLTAWGCDLMYGTSNPTNMPACVSVGCRPVHDVLLSKATGLPFVPWVHVVPEDAERTRFRRFLEDHALGRFFDVWTREFLDKGDVLIERGQALDAAYVIVRGRAELRHEDGRRISLSSPDMIGDDELLRSRRTRWSVVALTTLDVLVVDRATLLDRIATDPTGAVTYARLRLERDPDPEARPRGPARLEIFDEETHDPPTEPSTDPAGRAPVPQPDRNQRDAPAGLPGQRKAS